MPKLKCWKNTSKTYSDGSKSIEWKSKTQKVIVSDWKGWNVHAEYLRKVPSFIFTDTNNTKKQAMNKANKYMKNHDRC